MDVMSRSRAVLIQLDKYNALGSVHLNPLFFSPWRPGDLFKRSRLPATLFNQFSLSSNVGRLLRPHFAMKETSRGAITLGTISAIFTTRAAGCLGQLAQTGRQGEWVGRVGTCWRPWSLHPWYSGRRNRLQRRETAPLRIEESPDVRQDMSATPGDIRP